MAPELDIYAHRADERDRDNERHHRERGHAEQPYTPCGTPDKGGQGEMERGESDDLTSHGVGSLAVSVGGLD